MEHVWPQIFEYCDLKTCKRLFQAKTFDNHTFIERQLRKRCVRTIASFLKSVHDNMPWRSTHPFSHHEEYNMKMYLKIRNSKIGIKHFLHKLVQYYLFDPSYGHHLYLFNFKSRHKKVEERREELRESYNGSRYDLAKYVMTLGKEEVITHGI